METQNGRAGNRVPWNKGKLTGQKPPLKLPEIWAIRTRLQMSSNIRGTTWKAACRGRCRALSICAAGLYDPPHGRSASDLPRQCHPHPLTAASPERWH